MSRVSEVASPVDVTVMGAGLAATAASIHLAKAGFKVLCAGPDFRSRQPVGESLDWSAPELLAALGLPMDQLIADGTATYKRHVTLKLTDGWRQDYVPSEWMGRFPFNVELRTMHVDRSRLNDAIREIALNCGVTFLDDRVTGVDHDEKRVVTAHTAGGMSISCPWFVDASGSAAAVLPKTFRLAFAEYGPHKTAMWAYFSVPDAIEGTTLYTQDYRAPYMEWIWEIPIRRDLISVGYVATGDAIKAMRQRGLSIEEIFRTQLNRFPRFAMLLQASGPTTPHVTSFRCRVHCNIAGPNWVVIGEAAAMVDPMTSNGVTAALRHAAEASRLLIDARHKARLPLLAAAMYSRRVESMARFFNEGIEKVIYDWPIRNRIGVGNAGDIYTVPAWTMNAIYTRVRPRGLFSTVIFDVTLSLIRAGASLFYSICRQQDAANEAQA
jgi:menaquinone-9 beta-reductase